MSTNGQTGQVLKSLRAADISVCDEAASFLQSGFWGRFKSRFGWEARAFLAEWENGETKPLLVLRRKIAFGIYLAYVPWGPELPSEILCDRASARARSIEELAASLRGVLPKNTAFIRFDFPWFDLPKIDTSVPMPPSFVRSAVDVQVPDTVIIDLTQSIESIMKNMKPKWRYNARLAQKRGVKVYQADEKKIDCFYSLLSETAHRDGILIHGFEYYKTLFETSCTDAEYFSGKNEVRLFLAEHESDVIAGIITLFRGKDAVYLYGASSDEKRNLMAPYALQMKAMEDAKAYGCSQYDLFGIPPNEDPAHPMAGLYRFKTGFGGKIIHHAGCYDYPYQKIVYWFFRKAEKLRKKFMLLKKSQKIRKHFAQRDRDTDQP